MSKVHDKQNINKQLIKFKTTQSNLCIDVKVWDNMVHIATSVKFRTMENEKHIALPPKFGHM